LQIATFLDLVEAARFAMEYVLDSLKDLLS